MRMQRSSTTALALTALSLGFESPLGAQVSRAAAESDPALFGNSLLPFLFIAQIVGMTLAVRVARSAGKLSASQARPLFSAIGLLVLWAPISAWLAVHGAYTHPAVLENLPSFWITMAPIFILAAPWAVSETFRESINRVVETVGVRRVMVFEGLRVAAIGGIVKGLKGEFSPELAFFIGIPDLLFGVLSLVAAYLLA